MEVKNWAGNVTFHPKQILQPTSEQDIAHIIINARKQKKKIRVVGAGHSFSRLIETENMLLDLRNLSGLVKVDRQKKQATFKAGTPIKLATELLANEGLALPNQGDIAEQALAGAFSTGTHGTGMEFASLAQGVVAMRFIDGTGQVQIINEQAEGDVINACRVALGSCGILTEVTIQCLELYNLKMERRNLPLEEVLTYVRDHHRNHRHVEFFWFPYSPYAQLKIGDISTEHKPRSKIGRFISEKILEKALFAIICKIAKTFDRTAPAVSRLCGYLNPSDSFIEPSRLVFPSERSVRFTEMEYALPIEKGLECFHAIRKLIHEKQMPVFFPIEYRVAGSDSAWLSPMYGRESAIISIHVFEGYFQDPYFSAAEDIFRSFGGRPHWGKVHTIKSSEALEMYQRFSDFQTIRQTFDPDDLFVNAQLEMLFTG